MTSTRLVALGYRLGGWPRRVAALLCLLLAAGSALLARDRPAAAARVVGVVVAARDLPSGATLTDADLHVASWPASIRPGSAVERPDQLRGRRLAGPVRAGEPITTTRLLDGDITSGLPAGLVAVPVELNGTAAAHLVRPGEWVDVLAVPPAIRSDSAAPAQARTVAEAVRVLAVTPPASHAGTDGLAIVVAATRATALRLAGAAGGALLVTVRSPP